MRFREYLGVALVVAVFSFTGLARADEQDSSAPPSQDQAQDRAQDQERAPAWFGKKDPPKLPNMFPKGSASLPIMETMSLDKAREKFGSKDVSSPSNPNNPSSPSSNLSNSAPLPPPLPPRRTGENQGPSPLLRRSKPLPVPPTELESSSVPPPVRPKPHFSQPLQ